MGIFFLEQMKSWRANKTFVNDGVIFIEIDRWTNSLRIVQRNKKRLFSKKMNEKTKMNNSKFVQMILITKKPFCSFFFPNKNWIIKNNEKDGFFRNHEWTKWKSSSLDTTTYFAIPQFIREPGQLIKGPRFSLETTSLSSKTRSFLFIGFFWGLLRTIWGLQWNT